MITKHGLNFHAPNCILTFAFRHADVAELVDAQVSEACSRKGVEVRFFSSAFFIYRVFSIFSTRAYFPKEVKVALIVAL